MLDLNKTGYILLSPKYIKSKENKIENWHLFKAEIYMNDITELCDNIDEISIEEGEVKKVFASYDDYDNSSNKNKECIISIDDKTAICNYNPECNNKEIFHKDSDLGIKDFEIFFIKYNFKKIGKGYLKKCVEEYEEKHNINDIDKCDFKGMGAYYTDKNRTLFYSEELNTIRMLACLLGRSVCGSCIATLYGDNKKEEEYYL